MISPMSRREKLLRKLMDGHADRQFAFRDLLMLLRMLGFRHRQSGSHHIFSKVGIEERITLQKDGSQAKAYQVRQVRRILIRYFGNKND